MLLRKSAHNLLAEHPSLIELHLHFTSRNHNFNKHNSESHCCFLSQILSSSYKIPHSKSEPHSPIQTKPTSLSPILFKLLKNHRPKKPPGTHFPCSNFHKSKWVWWVFMVEFDSVGPARLGVVIFETHWVSEEGNWVWFGRCQCEGRWVCGVS